MPAQAEAVGTEANLREMFDALAQGDAIYQPSRFWESLNAMNVEQLQTDGIENLKRTVARNYFTWMVGPRSEQFRYLCRQMRLRDWTQALPGALTLRRVPEMGLRQWNQLRLFTRMLWRNAEGVDAEGLLQWLQEPAVGNPFPISAGGRLISQDLANSVIEYHSIREHFRISRDEAATICELGAGYGRNAYVFLNALPHCRYVIVDIPPALHIAQTYLGQVFPDRRIFQFRPFDRFEEVRSEIEAADIVFLLPHQAAMLPPKSVDLFVNISSLHEMKIEQVQAYFRLMDRLTCGWFYTKQWYVSRNEHDGIRIRHTDYPVPAHWQQLYHRTARVQTAFFEAMYAIHSPGGH